MIEAAQLSTMDSTALNFWLGTWKAAWSDSSRSYHGKNVVSKIMNDLFIHEQFEILDGPDKGYKGESFSILDKLTGQWRQTWIDNQGEYLDFIGKKIKDTVIFERFFINLKGDNISQKMRFYNITSDSYDWDWQSKKGDGNWKMLWKIKYTREKKI